jgi:hypothetical protein
MLFESRDEAGERAFLELGFGSTQRPIFRENLVWQGLKPFGAWAVVTRPVITIFNDAPKIDFLRLDS